MLYILALYDHSDQPGFVPRLVGCFQPEQTDDQLIAAVNNAFGTSIVAEDFTKLVGNVRSQYVDTSNYVYPTTKNNLDLVQWAISAEAAGWGYVWGTFGQVLTRDTLAAKAAQYPDNVGAYEEYIRSHYLGRRTADCVGFIKGYCWYDSETDSVNYATNENLAFSIFDSRNKPGSVLLVRDMICDVVNAGGFIQLSLHIIAVGLILHV